MSARVAKVDLANRFGASIGREKAVDVIDQAAIKLQLRGDDYSPDEAIALLDLLSATPGIIGTVARFAKVRFLLAASE